MLRLVDVADDGVWIRRRVEVVDIPPSAFRRSTPSSAHGSWPWRMDEPDVVHEVVFRAWPQMVAWLEEACADLVLERDLRAAARGVGRPRSQRRRRVAWRPVACGRRLVGPRRPRTSARARVHRRQPASGRPGGTGAAGAVAARATGQAAIARRPWQSRWRFARCGDRWGRRGPQQPPGRTRARPPTRPRPWPVSPPPRRIDRLIERRTQPTRPRRDARSRGPARRGRSAAGGRGARQVGRRVARQSRPRLALSLLLAVEAHRVQDSTATRWRAARRLTHNLTPGPGSRGMCCLTLTSRGEVVVRRFHLRARPAIRRRSSSVQTAGTIVTAGVAEIRKAGRCSCSTRTRGHWSRASRRRQLKRRSRWRRTDRSC